MIAVDPTYCPDCGGEVGTREFEGRARPYCEACERFWWRASVPTTSVAVVDGADEGVGAGASDDDTHVLLIQRAGGRDAGRWDLPAGHPERDEPAREAAARELREETGLRADPDALDLVGTVLSTGRRATYRSIDYRISREAVDGTVEPGSDAADARFVPVDAVRDGDVDVRELGRKRLVDAGLLE